MTSSLQLPLSGFRLTPNEVRVAGNSQVVRTSSSTVPDLAENAAVIWANRASILAPSAERERMDPSETSRMMGPFAARPWPSSSRVNIDYRTARAGCSQTWEILFCVRRWEEVTPARRRRAAERDI